MAEATLRPDELIARLEKSLDGPGQEIYAVAREVVDTYITGEAPHWAAVAAEDGIVSAEDAACL